MKSLFHIKDADRPMHVVATNMADALLKWSRRIAEENQMNIEDVELPLGVDFVAEPNDLLL